MSVLRVAVIGAGHLGRVHARILSGLADFKLAAVVDPVEKNRNEVAAQYAVPAFEDFRDALPLCDAAVVVTPTKSHFAVAAECLRAGKHLLIEKPMTDSFDEAAKLVRFAAERGLTLQVGHVERFNPIWRTAASHVRGAKYIEAVRRSGYTFRSTDIGVVFDLMIHDLDLILSLVQSPLRKVEALGIAIFGSTEDVANARLTFENGCIATLSASRASHSAARRMQLWGPRAFVDLDFAARAAAVVRPSEQMRTRMLNADRMPPEQKSALKDRLLSDHLPVEQLSADPVDAITAEWEDFAASVQSGRPPRVSGAEGAKAVEVAEWIVEEIAQHAWDGNAAGAKGPLAIPAPSILQGPHWDLSAAADFERRSSAQKR